MMQTNFNNEDLKAQKNFVNICTSMSNKDSCSKTISRLPKENLPQPSTSFAFNYIPSPPHLPPLTINPYSIMSSHITRHIPRLIQ